MKNIRLYLSYRPASLSRDMPNIITQFISGQSTARPALFFYNTNSPCLNPEEEINLKHVPQSTTTSNGYDENCVIVTRKDCTGLYTSGLGFCHALVMIERDDNGNISKLAMQHFSGGLTTELLEGFIDHSIEKGLTKNLELVHYPGDAATSRLDMDIATDLQNRNFATKAQITRIYHADPCTSCSVLFDGQIGSAEFAPNYLTKTGVTNVKLKSSELIKSNAETLFQALINSYLQDSLEYEKLTDLKNLILSDKLLTNPQELLEQTRQLVIKSGCQPEKKQDFFDAYAQTLNNQPSLSKMTRYSCLILGATIIGLIPAAVIAGFMYRSTNKKRREFLKHLDPLVPSKGPSNS